MNKQISAVFKQYMEYHYSGTVKYYFIFQGNGIFTKFPLFGEKLHGGDLENFAIKSGDNQAGPELSKKIVNTETRIP